MSKKFGAGRCVHCLQHSPDLTSDHVFPASWYPDSTPQNIEKWQMPACRKCNAEYGKLERDLLLRFGLCLGPSEFAALGVSDRALRALNPALAKSERDRRHREATRKKILSQLLMGAAIPQHAVLPWFEGDRGASREQQVGIVVPEEALLRLSEKLVRGMFYIRSKEYIEETHLISTHFMHDEDAGWFAELVGRFGVEEHRGPGVRIGLAVAADDPRVGMAKIELWGRVRIYAVIQKRESIAVEETA